MCETLPCTKTWVLEANSMILMQPLSLTLSFSPSPKNWPAAPGSWREKLGFLGTLISEYSLPSVLSKHVSSHGYFVQSRHLCGRMLDWPWICSWRVFEEQGLGDVTTPRLLQATATTLTTGLPNKAKTSTPSAWNSHLERRQRRPKQVLLKPEHAQGLLL